MRTATAPSEFAIGSTIADTYKIERLLGRGGMGVVLLASHVRLPGKLVAIKVLHAEAASDDVIARFKREAHIASLLAHPNIVHIEDFNVTSDGSPYLVLEYLQGESLAQRVAAGPLPIDAAMSILRQVGAALAVAHSKGVVHRDLKPQNIFLVPSEVAGERIEIAKVLDFGISKLLDATTAMTEENAMLGTPQYMAPEQATGQHGTIDLRTDVFSLGAIVYEMLTGKPAFTGLSVPEIVFKVVYEEPPPLPATVPSIIADAIRRAMAKQGTARFASVSAFVEAVTGRRISSPTLPPDGDAFANTMASERVPKLDAATLATEGGRSLEATVPSAPAPLPRHRFAVRAAIAGVLVAATGAAVAYFAMRGSPRTLDREGMKSVAAQLLTAQKVEIDGHRHPIGLNSKHLKFVKFDVGGHPYEAIEQNPETGSQWAALARQGKHVTQFRDLATNSYIGVIVDGELVTEAVSGE